MMAFVISSWATMLIEDRSNLKQFAFSLPTKSNTQRHFSYLEVIMRTAIFAVNMDLLKSVESSLKIHKCSVSSQKSLNVCLLLP